MSVDKKRADAELSDCDLYIIATCFLRLVLQRFFSTLVGVLSSATTRITTKYVLMVFIVLLLTISSNTVAISKSDEYRSAYTFDEVTSAA